MSRIFLLLFFAAGISVSAQIPAYMPACGLVAWYPFNGNANDLSVNRNNGTVYGARLITDRFGNANSAWYFDGISNYIAVPAIPALNFTDKLSISVWVKLDDYSLNTNGDPGRAIVGKQRSPDQTGFNILAVDSAHNYSFGLHSIVTNTTDDAPGMLPLSTWHNIVSVYDSMAMYLYKDGHLVHTSLCSITLTPSAQPLCIGKEGLIKRYFKGCIDDVALWNRALTPAEVLQIYNDTSMITVSDTVSMGKTIKMGAPISGGKWSSSSAAIATVDEHGVVAGVDAGKAVIWYAVPDECGSNIVIARMSLMVNFSKDYSNVIAKALLQIPEETSEKESSPKEPFSISADQEKEALTITTDTGVYTSYTITDRTGKVLIKQIIIGTQTKVDISMLLPGSYYIILEKDGNTKTMMFVKDK